MRRNIRLRMPGTGHHLAPAIPGKVGEAFALSPVLRDVVRLEPLQRLFRVSHTKFKTGLPVLSKVFGAAAWSRDEAALLMLPT